MKRLYHKHAFCTNELIIIFPNLVRKSNELMQIMNLRINPITLVLLFFLIFLNCEKALSQTRLSDEEIGQTRHLIATSIKELYTQRTNQPDTLFRMEPEMNKVAGVLGSDTFLIRHAEVDKTLIRQLLHAQFIYDYQVHYIKIPLKSLNSNTITQQIKEHERVKEIIKNPFANRIGVDIDVANDEHTVHLLFVERYVYIDKYITGTITEMNGGGGIHEIILTGKSFTDNLYYKIISPKAMDYTDLIINDKKEVRLDPDNRFSIRLSGGGQNVFFMDENGKILANRNFSR